jgi:hypothetical protein
MEYCTSSVSADAFITTSSGSCALKISKIYNSRRTRLETLGIITLSKELIRTKVNEVQQFNI